MEDSTRQDSAFVFTGSWKEFAPIGLTNLLLTIVTLGIYRFWARTRERQYLWSRSRFIDDTLEWTGTGMELFIGFLMAAILILLPILFLNFGIQALLLRGYIMLVAILAPALYLFLLFIFGLAQFRALRYRLSRTRWHGIRGGSADPGFAYGWSAVWKTIVGFIPAGLMIPWSMCELWNERWRAMSFGPHPFRSDARPGPLMGRFLLFYLLPVAGCILAVAGLVAVVGMGVNEAAPLKAAAAAIWFIILGVIAAYAAMGAIALAFYARYFREAVGHLSLTTVDFEFTASTMDWLKLVLGNILLLIITLGIGYAFWGLPQLEILHHPSRSQRRDRPRLAHPIGHARAEAGRRLARRLRCRCDLR